MTTHALACGGDQRQNIARGQQQIIDDRMHMTNVDRRTAPPPSEPRLQSLAGLATDLAGQFKLVPLLERILQHTLSLLDCDSGSICTVDEIAGTYRKEVDIGVGCLSGQTFPLDEGVTGEVVRARGTVVFDEYQAVRGGHIARRDRARLNGVLGVPIRSGGTIIGTCVVFSTEIGRRFTPADARLVELFATHAAIAITNARLHARATQRDRVAANLSERERAVRDAHDTVGRGLATVLVHLDTAERDVRGSRDPLPALASARDAARSAFTETQRIIPASTPGGRLRVLVVHERQVVRAGLVRLLGQVEPDIQVVGEAADAIEAVEAFQLLRPSVVLANLALPRIDGAQLTSYLRAVDAEAAVVLLIDSFADDRVRGAAQIGALGFVGNDAEPASVARSIIAAASGDSLVPAGFLRGFSATQGLEVNDALTARERQVRALVERGLADKQIGSELGISVKTVEKHVGSILRKTGAANRTMLAGRAWRVSPTRR